MIFALIPTILFWTLGPFMNDSTTLPKATALFLITILIFIIQKKYDFLTPKLLIIGTAVPFLYLVFGIVNHLNWNQLFVGAYGRNFGLTTLISIVLLFGIAKNYSLELQKYTDFSLYLLSISTIIYGYIQIFGIDPLPWNNKELQLTLGNINFSGAIFGILAPVLLHKLINSKNIIFKITNLFLFASSFYLGIRTQSFQSQIIFILTVSTYLYFISDIRKNRFYSFSKKIIQIIFPLAVLIVSAALFSNINALSQLKSRLYESGSIGPRFDYWKIAISMTRDHPIFGVGIDNFAQYSSFYKTKNQQLRDGVTSFVDKSHSSLFDHYANGGLIIGSLWVFVIVVATIYSIKAVKQEQDLNRKNLLILLLSVWIGYLFQTLISPDQIVLMVIGYQTLAILVWNYKGYKISNNYKNFVTPLKFIGITILIFSTFSFLKLIDSDIQAKSILNSTLGDKKYVLSYSNSWFDQVPATNILMGIVQIEPDCAQTNILLSKTLKKEERNSQAWFVKAVCSNKIGDFEAAILSMQKSLSLDPINANYLATLSKLEISANKLKESRATWKKLRDVMPDHPEVQIINQSLVKLGY